MAEGSEEFLPNENQNCEGISVHLVFLPMLACVLALGKHCTKIVVTTEHIRELQCFETLHHIYYTSSWSTHLIPGKTIYKCNRHSYIMNFNKGWK